MRTAYRRAATQACNSEHDSAEGKRTTSAETGAETGVAQHGSFRGRFLVLFHQLLLRLPFDNVHIWSRPLASKFEGNRGREIIVVNRCNIRQAMKFRRKPHQKQYTPSQMECQTDDTKQYILCVRASVKLMNYCMYIYIPPTPSSLSLSSCSYYFVREVYICIGEKQFTLVFCCVFIYLRCMTFFFFRFFPVILFLFSHCQL